ncbi:hypothetical protein K439DRAFT_1407843 [Ramaria rubella]|nr:hypothetical protein K439DRAFT_1407843 [Ramaria rubella]
MRLSFLLALTAFLAGQALATVNFTVGSTNFTAPQLLDFGSNNGFVATANCTSQCSTATSKITACGTNDQCVCANDTATDILGCEQCLFTYVIEQNIAPPNSLIGSQPALAAFIAGCAANPLNITIQALALTLPSNWDGPESLKLGTAATVVAVAAGAILGGGSLYILSTIE